MGTYDSFLDAEEQRLKQADATDAGSPYAAALDGEVEQAQGKLRASLNQAVPQNPDKAAKQSALASATDAPLPVVQRNEDAFAQAQRVRELQQIAASSPVLRAQLSNPQFAALAHDDAEHLSLTEKFLRTYLGASTKSGVESLVGVGSKLLEDINPFTTSEEDLATLYKNDPAKLRQMRAEHPALALSRFSQAMQEASSRSMQNLSPEAKLDYGNLEYATTDTSKAAYLSPIKVIGDAIQSLPTSLALAASMYFTKGAAAQVEQRAIAGGATKEAARQEAVKAAAETMAQLSGYSEGVIGYAQQANQTRQAVDQIADEKLQTSPQYKELLGAGFSPEAARLWLSSTAAKESGLGAGLADAITNFFGGKYLGKLIGEGGNFVPRVLRGAGAEGLTEAVQSGLEQLSQNAATRALDPTQDLADQVLENIVMGLFVGGVTGGAFSGVLGHSQKAEQAQSTKDVLGELAKLAEASKLRERAPGSFAEFVQQASEGGPAENVYVNGNVLMQEMQKTGIAPETLPAEVTQQLVEAQATNGDVRIPIGEYSARIATSDMGAALLDHLKTSPEAMSAAEAKTFMQDQADTFKQQAETILAGQKDNLELQQGAETVKQHFVDQLTQANRFTPDVNHAYASLMRDFYVTTAQRLGITPQEMLARYPLRVVAENVAGQRVMDQGMKTATPEQIAPGAKLSMGLESYAGRTYHPVEIVSGSGDRVTVRFLDDNLKGAKGTERAIPASALFSGERVMDQKSGRVEPIGFADVPRTGTMKYHGPRAKSPGADWGARDLQDSGPVSAKSVLKDYGLKNGKAVAYTAWVDVNDLPSERLVEEEDGDEGGYDWSEMEGLRGSYPPAKLRVTKDGKIVILDGNHRIRHWTENGAEYIPAWVVDERKGATSERPDENVLEQPGLTGAGYWEGPGGEFVETDEVPSVAERTLELAQNDRRWHANPAPLPAVIKSNRTLKQAGARGQIAFGSDTTQSPTVITLLKTADLSTFLHETGHFFLEVTADIANRPGAPAEVRQDMDTLLKWFGVKDLATWRAMSLDEQRPSHEKFARAFESYLFEGKAPNVEMQSLFGRFRAWLLNVYKSLSALNVTLTDEVRGTFDRMLASEEQIRAAEAARGYAPLFKSAEEAGMSSAEWQSYQETGKEATETAVQRLERRSLKDMQWLTGARGRALKALQKGAEEKRKAVQAEVEAEVAQQPIYVAIHFLKAEEKLSLPALKEMYGEGPAAPWRYLATGQAGLAATEGMHPDMAAELFGFSSGDELVRKILDAQPEAAVVEGMTDQRMLERYGDLATPQALERAADAAVHNDARAKFVAAELKALNRAMNPREKTAAGGSVNILQRAAKQFAEVIIARKKVKDIKPSQYAAAEARAARNAERAKSLVEKATEKRNQLVNNYAAKIAGDAVAEVERDTNYLKKFNRESILQKLDPEYNEQIQSLLERYDLRTVTGKELKRRTSLVDWVESQHELGFEPNIDKALLAEANRQHYSTLTLEEFRGLVEAVKNIEHLGRLKKELLTAQKMRDFAAVVNELKASIDENAKGKTAKERKSSDRGALVAVDQVFRDFMADHRKFASLARELDGWKDAGPMWEYLVRSMNTAGNFEAVEREKATTKLSEILAPLFKGEKLGKKTYIAAIDKTLTREERIGIALNMGNAVNRERVLTGERWTPAQLNVVLNSLQKEEWQFVQATWNYLESFRPQIAEKQRRLTGVEPEWVEAEPITTAHGTFRGGYYPIKYDPLRSSKAEADTAAEVQRQMERGLYTRAMTRRGHLEERVKSTGRPMRYDLGVIATHLEQVIHDLAWHEWLVDSNRLLRALDGPIRDHYGPEKLRTMRDTLRDIAVGEIGAQTAGDSVLNYLRHGATIVGLGWRLTTSLLQPFGLTQSMSRIGTKWVLKGASHWFGDAMSLENSMKEISAKSDFMRLRAKTMQREISEIRNKVSGKDSRLEASYFYLIQKMQLVADIPTWFGAYEKAMATVPDESNAIALADQAVIDAQGSGQIKDLAKVQRGSPAWKLFTNFYSFFNTTYNLTREAIGRTNFKSPGDISLLAADMALLYTIPALLGTLMKVGLSGDWDDEAKLMRRIIADQLNYLFGTVVVLRELSAGIQGALGLAGGDYTGPASVRLFSAISSLTKQAAQGEADEPFWKALNNAAGLIFHYPAGQINSTADGIKALYDGETKNPGVLVTGAPKR